MYQALSCEAPEESQPAFASGDVLDVTGATGICFITERHSLLYAGSVTEKDATPYPRPENPRGTLVRLFRVDDAYEHFCTVIRSAIRAISLPCRAKFWTY